MATTPPVRTSVQTPSTPLHGSKYDRRQHPTRKSTRHTLTRSLRAFETPPPDSDDVSHNSASLGFKKSTKSRSDDTHIHSPPSSTLNSPRKKPRKSKMLNRSDGAKVTSESNSAEVTSLDPAQDQGKDLSSHQPPSNSAVSMLPTPAKTPRKKPIQPGAMNAAARVLFPVHSAEDAMPTPRKKRNKRHVGFSLYSSMEGEEDDSSEGRIQIYTDSKDKVPELDPSEDNPFYEPPEHFDPPPAPMKRNNLRKRKATSSVENSEKIKDAFDREEGMVYVFRGKKIYRKFSKEGDDLEEEEADEVGSDHDNVRPLTRSSIKPRLLFPSQKQRAEREAADLEDEEEAPTDIEEQQQHVTTPVKHRVFSPPTPPTTGHATRSSTKQAPPEPVEAIPYKGKKVSPFDGWTRKKAGTGGGTPSSAGGGEKGRKREGEALEKADFITGGGGGSKKIKGNGVT